MEMETMLKILYPEKEYKAAHGDFHKLLKKYELGKNEFGENVFLENLKKISRNYVFNEKQVQVPLLAP